MKALALVIVASLLFIGLLAVDAQAGDCWGGVMGFNGVRIYFNGGCCYPYYNYCAPPAYRCVPTVPFGSYYCYPVPAPYYYRCPSYVWYGYSYRWYGCRPLYRRRIVPYYTYNCYPLIRGSRVYIGGRRCRP